jgi:hypothetical protein
MKKDNDADKPIVVYTTAILVLSLIMVTFMILMKCNYLP